MKILTHFRLIIITIVVAIGFVSCNKDAPKLIDLSGLSIINASPSKESLEVFVDNTKVTNDTEFTFGSKLDYLTAYSGIRVITVKQKGTDKVLISQPFKLDPQFGYSLFIIDKFPEVKLMFLPDNLTKPPKGKASVRFANFSPDSNPLTLTINNGNYVHTDFRYKSYSNANFIDAGDRVTFVIREHITTNFVASLADIKIEEGKIYTIYVNGLKAAKDETKLDVAIYTHK